VTTYPTITGTGAGGNNGNMSDGEDFLRNRTRRKRLFPNGKEVPDPFGSRMSGVQIPPLRPFRVVITDLSYDHSYFLLYILSQVLLAEIPSSIELYSLLISLAELVFTILGLIGGELNMSIIVVVVVGCYMVGTDSKRM